MTMTRPALILCVAAAVAICYAPILLGMANQWWSDEDMSHGFLVPLVAVWIGWRERDRWRNLPLQSSPWGLAILAVGAALHLAASLGAGLFAGSLGFLVSVIGVVVCFGGFRLLRAWLFPLALLLFMLPKLAVVYNQVTLPLQLVASRMAAAMLSMAGLGVIREGNILEVRGHQILVAEACNGIRYLLPLGFLSVTFAYLADSKIWMRIALLITAVPIAIVANAGRVAIAGWSPAFAEGTLHAISGVVVFVLCLAALAGSRWIFNLAGKWSHV